MMCARRNSLDSSVETDIVVIGGGGTGLASAVTAAERGSRVTLLEKRALGGNSALTRGIFAANSPVHQRQKITFTSDQAFNFAINYSHWSLNANLIRAFVNKSGDTIQWLEEKGLRFGPLPDTSYAQFPCFHGLDNPAKGGEEIIRILRKYCDKSGVQILRHTPVIKITTGTGGKVTGVLAKTKEGEIRIKAKSVIIASGGYGGSKDLMRKYYPNYDENMVYIGVPNKGDGILMATDIGAATEGLGHLLLHGQVYKGAGSIAGIVRDTSAIWINRDGERFADETVATHPPENGNVVARQPGGCVYVIFDEAEKNRLWSEMSRRPVAPAVRARPSMDVTTLTDDLRIAAEKNAAVRISDSWNDIANWIGIAPEAIQTTISKYNEFCDRGYDADFNKESKYLIALREPPFYAIKCFVTYLTTVGGIKINHYMQVINCNDKPIPGLYAGGDCTGGWESDTYCMHLAGSAFSFALNSGRIAGENAALYALGK